MSSPIKPSNSILTGSTGFKSKATDNCIFGFVNYNGKKYEIVFKFKREDDYIKYKNKFGETPNFTQKDFVLSRDAMSLLANLEGTTTSNEMGNL